MNKIRRMLFLLCGIGIITTIITVISSKMDTSLAAKIEENFAQMSELSVEQALSSNPYDYINNEYYENIVSLGIPAIEILETNYHNGEYAGLNAYIAALAIEDIANMNLYECTGNDWENAEEFFTNWDKTIKTMPSTLDGIVNSETTVEEKVNAIKKYGVFGQAFLTSIEKTDGKSIEFGGKNITIHEDISAEIQEDLILSTKHFKEIVEYMNSCVK